MNSSPVKYTHAALDDLDQIWSEVFDVSADIDTAQNYVDGIRQAISKKAGYSKTGIPLLYNEHPTGMYFVVYKKYYAFYRIHSTYIEVIRVLYGASDYMRVLFDGE